MSTPIELEKYFFPRLSPNEVAHWAGQLRAQRVPDTPLSNDGFVAMPCRYIICQDDPMIPAAAQAKMIHGKAAQGAQMEALPFNFDHSPELTATTELAQIILDFGTHLLGVGSR